MWFSPNSWYYMPLVSKHFPLAQKKLRGLSPRANYTWSRDCGLSTKLVPTFTDRGRRMVSTTNPHGRILRFIDRSRCFSFQVAPQMYSWGRVDSIPNHFSQNLEAPRIEPGPLDLKPGTLTTRPQKRSFLSSDTFSLNSFLSQTVTWAEIECLMSWLFCG
jgi:hypothetical protein